MIYYIYIYIYIKQEYKSLLPLNEQNIFENVPFVVVKMKSGKHEIFPKINVKKKIKIITSGDLSSSL